MAKMNGSLAGIGKPSYGDSKTKKTGKDDQDLHKRLLEQYEDGWNKDRDNQEEAYRDLRMIGDDHTEHWDGTALKERNEDGRPALVVNQVPQFVRQITGDMRQLKPAIKVVPVNDAASKEVAAKVLPGMIRYIEQRSRAQQIYFGAADQQAGCGIGHWRVTHEYASINTFEQEIRIEPVSDGVAVVWDADAVLPDRSDAMYCFVPVDMVRRKFEEKYPDKNADSLQPNTPACFSGWASDDHVRVAECFYVVPEKKLLAMYPDGAIDDVTDDPEGQEVAQAAGAQIEERDGRCVYRALITASDILEGPEKWPGPDIPIVPLIGEEVMIGRSVVRRGVARGLRDVQRIFNYAISTKTEVVALQPKSPWVGTREQFEKYQDQWENANQRNLPYLEYTHVNGVPMPQRSSPTVNTQHLDGLLLEMQGAMNATTGIYPAALGAKSNETSGRAIVARQREGDTGTYVYVSNFAGALQRTGQIIVNMIPQIYDTKRTIQITGEDGKIDSMPINQPGFDEEGMGPGPALNDVTVGAYQVAVEMGPSFSSKREEARDGMNELLRTLGPEGAMLFIDLLVKQMDWPLSDKIAERAKFLLPPAIQAKEAKEAGEQPPEPPPLQPPSPEEMEKMQEDRQKNLELARKNEIEEGKLELERQTRPEIMRLQEQLMTEKIKVAGLTLQMKEAELEARRCAVENDLRMGAVEFDRMGERIEIREGAEKTEAQLAEETQGNIEKARANETAYRQQDIDTRKMEQEAEIDQKQQQEINDLKGHIAELTNALIDMKEELSVMSETAGQPDANMGAISSALTALASRKQPTGVKRTKDGMEVLYGGATPTPPETPGA